MKNGNRKFSKGEVMHVYQRARYGFNIFYTLNDYLVFFTIFSVFARRFDICVLSLCLMVDHFHALLVSNCKASLSNFIGSVTSLYARLFNETVGKRGQVFDKSYGSAPKLTEKQVRTSIPYLFNNPVEKMLCADPNDYRWNFLAYLSSDFPFSERIYIKKASRALRSAVKEVRQCFENGLWLNYIQLNRLYGSLTSLEQNQLTDYIIQTYNPFNKTKLVSYYKSLDLMNLAIRSTTGSEYDIKEDFHKSSDSLYSEIERCIYELLHKCPKSLLALPVDEKIEIARQIAANTRATNRQIAKYLHLPLQSGGA